MANQNYFKQLAGVLVLSLVLMALVFLSLQLRAQAGWKAGGAGGCGDFDQVVYDADPGDVVVQMATPKNSGGALITKSLHILGGWYPLNGQCDGGNDGNVFTDAQALLDAGFVYTPTNLTELLNDQPGQSVLNVAHTGTLTMQNLSLYSTNFTQKFKGGAIGGVFTDATLLLDNVHFPKNLAGQSSQGGGLYLEMHGHSTLVMSGTAFYSNTAGYGGGFEIHLYDHSRVIIDKSEFRANQAGAGGGAGRFVVHSGAISITDSSFYSNTTIGNGGALSIETTGEGPASIYIVRSRFMSNTAVSAPANPAVGGAVIIVGNTVSPPDVILWQNEFSGNTALQDPNVATLGAVNLVSYTLSLTTSGNGSVSANPNQSSYPYGTVVTLTATAGSNSDFTGWRGDATGSTNPLTVSITADTAITATFDLLTYTLSLTSNGNGSVSANPDQPSYPYGTVVTLTATPDSRYTFAGWRGDATGSTNPLTVSITADTAITATFASDYRIYLPLTLKNYPWRAVIDSIAITGDNYEIEFHTIGFTPQLPGDHVHFFFDTVDPLCAGMTPDCNPAGPWKVYGGGSPFTGYKVSDRPAGAEKMCVLVANPDHSVRQNTGNCYPLP